jgi:uncharacterized membrane protein HdeD (DUF308 family)
MRAVTSLIYLVMAAWLLISAGLRIVLLLRSGSELDALPFISGTLGLLALATFLIGDDKRHARGATIESGPRDRA